MGTSVRSFTSVPSGRCSGAAPRANTRGRLVQVDPVKPKLKPPGIKRLKLSMIYCFQVLLSKLTCAATPWDASSYCLRWNVYLVGRCRLTLSNPS